MSACGECEGRRPAVTRARSLLWLDEDTKRLVHRIKFGGRFELFEFFRPVFVDRFDPFFPSDAVIVPVPLHPSRFLERGFNQAEILGRWVASLLQLKMAPGGLRKIHATMEQKSLNAVERARNLRRSLEWVAPVPPPAHVLLVDDVWTTGMTTEACARVLLRAGCESVFAWTLFRTPKLV
jgi:ComF family protein